MFFKLKLAVALAVGYVLLSPPAEGGASDPRPLQTRDAGRGWEGVGRLNMGQRAFCTGALIAENLVLTAAHCLFDRDDGRPVALTEIEFLAGWRLGRARAYRGVRRAVVHPRYAPDGASAEARVRYDLALLELDRPIRSAAIRPFAVHAGPRQGDAVGVVSYAFDRADSPALQEACLVLARQSGALVMSCEVDFGASGAPVFVIEDGVAQIVSVVSAKAMARDVPVSLGTELAAPLGEMLALLERTGADRATGARFLRP